MFFNRLRRIGLGAVWLVALCALTFPAHAQTHATGLIFAQRRVLDRIPLAARPFGAATLPANVDLSPYFPSPGNQGPAHSCVGWAVAYLKTYQERVDAQYNGLPTPPMFSPAFIYNQVNNGRDGGASIPDALRTVSDSGAVTWPEMPYQPGDYLTQPSAPLRRAARRYRFESYRQVNVDDTKELQAHLAAGFPIVIGAVVDEGFQRLGPGEVWRSRIGLEGDGHAMVLVGYDEARRAFRVINSWGTGWGSGGYGWIDFDYLREVVREGYVAKDAPNGAPSIPPQPIGPEPAPQPAPTPTPTPAPPPAVVSPYAYVSATNADALMGIYGEALPQPLLEAVRTITRQGHRVTSVAITGWGGWLVTYGTNGYWRSQLPRDLDSTIVALNQQRETIRRVAIAPTGAWIILRGARNAWVANGLPPSVLASLRQITAAGEIMTDAGFLSDGTLVLVRSGNGWLTSSAIPLSLSEAFRSVNQNRESITRVAFGPNLSWLLVRGTNGNWRQGIPAGLLSILQGIRASNGTVGYVGILPNGGWIVVQR